MVSSAETLGALKWGFDTVNLNRPTSCEWRHSAGTGGEERLVGFENDDDRRPAEDDSRAADGDAFDFLSLTGSGKRSRSACFTHLDGPSAWGLPTICPPHY